MLTEAIKYLLDIGASSPLNDNLPAHVFAAGNDIQFHDIEKKLPGRVRFRGKFATYMIKAFTDEVAANATMEGSACFVDDQCLSATAIFNLGSVETPEHCDWVAKLVLKETPEYKALDNVTGTRMDQKELAEFLEDWRDAIVPLPNGEEDEPGSLTQAIHLVRNLTVEAMSKADHTTDDFKASRTAMEAIEAKGKDGPPPKLFRFTCVPYEGLTQRNVFLRLSITTGREAPSFTLRMVRPDALRNDMVLEFADLLSSALADTCPVRIGTFTP